MIKAVQTACQAWLAVQASCAAHVLRHTQPLARVRAQVYGLVIRCIQGPFLYTRHTIFYYYFFLYTRWHVFCGLA